MTQQQQAAGVVRTEHRTRYLQGSGKGETTAAAYEWWQAARNVAQSCRAHTADGCRPGITPVGRL